MAKKVTKKQTTKAKVVKKTKVKKAPSKESMESGSLSIMILAIVGIILLVYFSTSTFSTSTEVSVDKRVGDENTEDLIQNNKITISGKTYNSSTEAYSILKEIPQTRRTNEETGFVESYTLESYK